MKSKDKQILEEAYASIFAKTVNAILNEEQYVKLKKITDGGAGHGGHVAAGPVYDEDEPWGEDRHATYAPRNSEKKKFPKYCKLVTGKDYPQIDKWLHGWYNDSAVAGGGPTYAEMEGPISDFNIRHWLEGDNGAIKFFIKNKVALMKAAKTLAS